MANEGNKKVLMIAYQYPPIAAGGVCRTAKFSQFLPEFGWIPHVLTVSNSPQLCEADAVSVDLGSPTRVRVHRTRSYEVDCAVRMLVRCFGRFVPDERALAEGLRWRLGRLWGPLSAPDPLVYWALPAVPRALRLIRRHQIDVLYSTSWPYSDHLAALLLHRFTGRPWIADFRDPFTNHFNYGADSPRKDRFNRWLEAEICRHARFVISPTLSATQRLRTDHPDVQADRFVTIRNGFDETEFAERPVPSEEFEILHTGSFYLSRRPDLFLRAVELFLKRCPQARPATRVTFMGLALDHMLGEYERYPFVTAKGWCPRTESIRSICRSPVLLLVRHPECDLTIPGKLYEYMAGGNHILALTGNQPEVIRLLQQYENASILPSPSVEQLADQLESLFRRYRAGRLRPVPMTPFVHSFSRRRQTGDLARLLTVAAGALIESAEPAVPEWAARGTLSAAAARVM